MSNSHHQPTYARHRYPKEIIAYAVWLYHRFCLSYRDVEDLLAERGVIVSYETIRRWCIKFGHAYARRIRRNRGQIGDKWHLDEVFVTISGKRSYLYRAIDQYGNILDILLLRRRNRDAVLSFLRKLRSTYQRRPRVIITDKLRSYQAALRSIFSGVEHRQHKGLNNRIEASHRRTRKRQRFMQQFPSRASAQRFLSAFEFIQDFTCPKRHLSTASAYRSQRDERYEQWSYLTDLAT
ncbi:MAG: IS6 family transposase [Chloroflexota bacterium]